MQRCLRHFSSIVVCNVGGDDARSVGMLVMVVSDGGW